MYQYKLSYQGKTYVSFNTSRDLSFTSLLEHHHLVPACQDDIDTISLEISKVIVSDEPIYTYDECSNSTIN